MPDRDPDQTVSPLSAPAAEVLCLVPADREAVFVLAVDPDAPRMTPLLTPRRLNGHTAATLTDLLGLAFDESPEVELLDPADLSGIGLSGYLDEGLGLDSRDIGPDAALLDSLTAPVVLLRGRLAGTRERRLTLPPGLTLIGRYGTRPAPIGLAPLPARAVATGTLPPPQVMMPAPVRVPRPWQVTLLLAGLTLLGLFLWLALARG